VESATGWWVHGARDLPGQPFAADGLFWVRFGDGADQLFRVWVDRALVDIFDLSLLDHTPQVHDSHPVTDAADHPQVVGYEQDREGQVLFEIHEEVQDLGLD